MSKRVVIACGSGIATSTLAVHKFQNFCDENGIDVQITQCSYGETDGGGSALDHPEVGPGVSGSHGGVLRLHHGDRRGRAEPAPAEDSEGLI